jgi:hypothetical protein
VSKRHARRGVRRAARPFTYAHPVSNRTLLKVGLGVAAGFVTWDILRGVGIFLVVLASSDNTFRFEPLSWRVDGRTLTVYQLVLGIIEAALLLLLVWGLRRRWRKADAASGHSL